MLKNYKVLIALLIGTCFLQSACGALFDELTATDKTLLTQRLSGAMTVPSGQSVKKGILDIKATLKNQLPIIDNITANLNVSSVFATKLQDLKTQASQLSDYSQIPTLSGTLIELTNAVNQSALPTTIKNRLIGALDFKRLVMLNIDLSQYVFNMDRTRTFWMTWSQIYLSNVSLSTWYNNFFNQFNQSQHTAAALSVEIPNDMNGQIILGQKFDQLYRMNPTIFAKFFELFALGNTNLTASIMSELNIIGKHLSCSLLKKVDFMDYYTNYFNPTSYSVELFERILQCNALFAYDGAMSNKAKLLGSLPSDLKGVLAQKMGEYLILSGTSDPLIIFDVLDDLSLYLPTSTFQTLINQVTNSTFARALFVKYNIPSVYYQLNKEYRVVIANFVARYFRDNLNKTWDAIDITIFTTVALDMNDEDKINLLAANNNYRLLLPITDTVSIDFWKQNCKAALLYYNFLTKTLQKNADPAITIDRLKPMLVCKNDCSFPEFGGKTTAEITELAKKILPILNPKAQAACVYTLGQYLKVADPGSLTVADLLNRIGNASSNSTVPINTFLSPSDIKKLDPNVVSQVYKVIANSNLDKNSAREICRKVLNQTNPNLADLKSLIKGLSADFLKNISDSEIINNLPIIIDNHEYLSEAVLQYLYSKLTASKSNLLKLLQSGNNRLANKVKLDDLKNLGITLNDVSAFLDKLPDRIRGYIAQLKNQNRVLSDFNATNINEIADFLNHFKPSDLQKLRSTLTDNQLEIIFQVSKANPNIFKSSQVRRVLAMALFDYLKRRSSGSVADIIAQLTPSILDKIDPKILIEIPSDILAEIAKDKTKILLLGQKVSQFSTDDCTFSRDARRALALAVYNVLVANPQYVTPNVLDSLGWLAPNLPMNIIVNMNQDVFISRMIPLFATPIFQLSAADAATFTNYLDNIRVAKNMSYSDFGLLAFFLKPAAFSGADPTQLLSFCQAGYSWYYTNQDKINAVYKQCRIGLTSADDNDMGVRAQAFETHCRAAANQLGVSLPSGRRKRAASTTCKIDTTDQALIDCLTQLGSDNNNLLPSELATIASNVKAFFNGADNIPDSAIIDANEINVGYSASDLALLKPTTLESLITLGKLNRWTSAQLTALATNPNIKDANLLTDSARLNAAFNIICGLTSTDINSISNTVFTQIVDVIGKISIENCGSRSALYGKAKSVYGTNIWNPDNNYVQELGTILSALNPTDFTTYVTPDFLNKLTPQALKFLSPTILNLLNLSYISSLENEQISSILSSSQISSVNPTVVSLLISTLAGPGPFEAKASSTDPITAAPAKHSSASSIVFNPLMFFSFIMVLFY